MTLLNKEYLIQAKIIHNVKVTYLLRIFNMGWFINVIRVTYILRVLIYVLRDVRVSVTN